MSEVDWNLDPDAPGRYEQRDDGTWMVCPPGRRMLASIADHTVIEHDDGTITAEGSIGYSVAHDRHDYWHGWLRHGIWSTDG